MTATTGPFRAERNPNTRGWHPWCIRHVESSLSAGTFRYRDSARAAAAAMNAVGERYRIDSVAACNEPATRAALLAARKPHDEADRERWLAVYRRKRSA